MSIQDFFKLIGLDINTSLRSAAGYSMIDIVINYFSRAYGRNEVYKSNVYFTSSISNCGLLYFDGFNDIACGLSIVGYLLDKKAIVKWGKLSSEDKKELGLLYTKYVIYQSWKSAGINKNLIFMHTGYKSNNGSFSKEICIPFMDIVDAYFESPVNKNSNYTQLHGTIDVRKLAYLDDNPVPDKFVKHFTSE